MTTPRNLTGLFLGAGASYEAGMPLAWELSAKLKQWLTPDKLRWLNESWRSQGGGYPDVIIYEFASLLSRSDQHYESLLGYLETQFLRRSPNSEQYHDLYSWLVAMVYHLLYFRHVIDVDSIQRRLLYYSGVSVLADQNKPLWVFSLNHDVIVECLAKGLDIPLSAGFTSEQVSLPRRNQQGEVIGDLKAEVLPGDQLQNSAMPFFQHGTRGINLLKIHGALDVFTFRDGKDLLRILPLGDGVDGPLCALRAANEDILYRPELGVNATNEIIYADETGEMQFLRRSLLAGAFKFDPRHTQALPPRLLEHFRSNINSLQSLVCIGYGFGDTHINGLICKWLEFSKDRRLVIVAPGVASVPAIFLHVAPQVELHPVNATDYLDSCAGVVRSKNEKIDKRFDAWMRRNSGKERSEKALDEFQRFFRGYRADELKEWLKTLPLRDGDIDTDSLGMSVAELVQEAKRQSASYHEVLGAFLDAQDNLSPEQG